MAIKTLRVFQEFTSSGYIPMPVAGNIDYGVTIANTFPATTPTTFQTDNPDLTVTLTETTDYYVWIRSHGTDWNPMFTRNVRVYPDSALVNNVVMGIIIANLSNTVPYTGANANVNLGNYGITANYLGVNLTPLTTPTTAGDIFWDIQDGTLNVNLLNGYVSHLGGDLPVLVKSDNNSGLTKGSVVYQKGSDGANTTVLLAQANSEATSSKTFGIIANTTSGGAKAYCVTFGYVRGVNTSALTEGATIYLSPTVAGGFTSTKPQAPNHIVTVGRCIKSHATVGVIFVSIQNGFEMDELHDVQITGALNKDVLVYDLSTQLWKNRRIFKTQGYVPFYDDTLLLDNSPIYTNGNYVGIGTETITEKLTVNGNVRAAKFIKVGGASTDFLKGDGSSDPTAYQPLSADLTAIDALALTTGLLRKNGTDTWELDQTEYLSVANAISTYQTLANLSSNLTASTTKYPSVNAVNAGLALKLNLTGGTLTGGLTLNYSYPTIALSDVSSGTTWNILNDGSSFKLNYGATNKFYIFANGNAEFINNLTASSLIKAGGTSTQFLKADGSVDSTTYQPYDADLSSIAGLALTTGLLRKNGANNWELDQTEYLPLATAISSYQTISNLSSNLTASSTKYPSVNAVNTGLGLKLNLTGGTLSGDLAISSSIPTLQLSDTSSGTIWNVTNDGGTFKINSGITNKFAMLTSGNASFVGDLTANKFIKVGGTSAQFLMADGSVSSGNAGTVTSVGLSAPTGFSVSGSPVTSSGTLALAFSAGYSLPSDATQATWTAKQNALNGTGFVKISGTTISYDNSTYYLASNPSGYTTNVGTVTSVAMSVPTGLSISGTPITTSGTLALSLTAGYSIPTTASQGTWDTAYNRSLTSIGVSGTTTKTLTLTKQDGSTLTASWSDINTDAVTSVFGRTGAIVATSGDYTTAQVTESGNLYYTDARARASISGGTGISYNSTTGVITNTITQYTDALARASLSFVAGSGAYNSTTGVITIPTNNNQIANGAGYITGYTETDTLATVTSRGATTSTETIFFGGLKSRKAQTAGDYTTASLWTESYNNTATGIAFHISGVKGTFLEMRTNSVLYWDGNTVYHSGNLTNLNQLTNGPGYISGITSLMVTNALGYTPYNSTNPSGYISGITSGMVTTALGYTPVTNARTLTINGTAYDLSADRSWTISGTIGGLTSGYIPKATSASTLGNSLIYDNGSAIGIGTSSPSQLLTLGGAATVQMSIVSNSTGGSSEIYFGSPTSVYRGYIGYNHGTDNMVFHTAASEKVRISSGGNLLVGTTTDAGYKLDVNGTGRFSVSGIAPIVANSSGTSALVNFVNSYGSGTYIGDNSGSAYIYTNTLPRLIISNSGNATFSSYVTVGGSITIGTSGNYGAGSIYSDGNWGMLFRAKQASPTNAEFRWSNSADSELMRLTSAGNLGLGTTSVTNAKLKVSGSSASGAIMSEDTTSTTSFVRILGDISSQNLFNWQTGTALRFATSNQDYSSFVERMRLDSSGNLGLGVTPSAWANIFNVIEGPRGSVIAFQNNGNSLKLGSNFYYTGVNYNYINTNAATRYDADAEHRWYTAPSGTAGTAISFTQAMTLDASGNLLLGATSNSQGAKLKIAGGYVYLNETGGADVYFRSSYDSNKAAIQVASANDLVLVTSNTSRITLFSNGNLALVNGTATDSGYKLDVNGTGRFSSNFYVSGGTNVNTGNGIHMYYESSYAQIQLNGASGSLIDFSTSGTDSLGRIIYTNSSNQFEFKTNGVSVLTLASTGAATFSSSVSATSLRSSGVGTFAFNTVNNGEFQIYATAIDGMVMAGRGSSYDMIITNKSGSDVFRIPTGTTTANFNGNVGIGTSSPGAMLDIYHATNGYASVGLQGYAGATKWYLTSGISGVTIQDFSISNNNNGTSPKLRIDYSTGAATFSSSVTAASFFESSDKTLKTLLVDNYQAKGIESIVAKLYTKNGKEELGYFAQDVQGILPSAVSKGSDGLLNLSYREVLVAKVQFLEQRVKELEAKLN